MMRLNGLDWVALILVVIGGLNWGLVGLFGFDLVAWLFVSIPIIGTIIYILVGLAAIYMIVWAMKKQS